MEIPFRTTFSHYDAIVVAQFARYGRRETNMDNMAVHYE